MIRLRNAFTASGLLVFLVVWLHVAHAAPSIQTVFFDMPQNLLPQVIPTPTQQLLNVAGYPNDPARMTFIARLYLPDPELFGAGPYPTVLFLHGSGGLWSNDVIPDPITAANSPVSQFRDWGNLLVAEGYACLFPDSYNPRGIAGGYASRRPSHDSAVDDALCSPNYERPKDVVASLSYLASRSDIDRERIAMIGFSHGAQTGMNALVDASVDLGNYQVDYIDLVDDGQGGTVEQTIKLSVPSPVRIPSNLPIPKFCAFYYGGGSHYGYHGQASSTVAGRYMLDRRTKAILFHGTSDSLMGVSNPSVRPIAGTVYPIKQVLASANQAATLSLANPIVRHYVFDRCAVHAVNARVGHSFDSGTTVIANPLDWDTVNESPDQKAKRLARDEVLRWLEFSLRAGPQLTITRQADPALGFNLQWSTRQRLSYRLFKSTDDFQSWTAVSAWANGAGAPMQFDASDEGRAFFRISYQPQEAPVAAPENAGFFLDYADFGL